MKRKIVIFDLDGTLALIEKRRAFKAHEGGKINWKEFFNPKNISMDEPNVPVIHMFNTLKKEGHMMVVFSGRDSVTRQATEKWLDKHGIAPDILVMRPKGSYTPDNELKRGWLYDLLEATDSDKGDILCIFDDRDQVVNMWREEGLTCFQVAPGSF